MKPRDVIVTLLLATGIVGFLIGVAILEATESKTAMWIALVISAFLWICYILLVIRDNAREKHRLKNPVLWMVIAGEDGIDRWTAMDGSGRTRPLNSPPPSQPIYDQEDDK